MERIEIYGRDPGRPLPFDLGDLIGALEPVAAGLSWYVLEWEGISNPGPAMFRLQRELKGGIVGAAWSDLKQLATEIFQTQDALIVGLGGIHRVPSAPLGDDVQEHIVQIEAISNHLWTVASDLPGVIGAVEAALGVNHTVRRV